MNGVGVGVHEVMMHGLSVTNMKPVGVGLPGPAVVDVGEGGAGVLVGGSGVLVGGSGVSVALGTAVGQGGPVNVGTSLTSLTGVVYTAEIQPIVAR